MMRIRRNDTVQIMTGRDKGKRGLVLEVDRDKGLVKVAGLGMVTKHLKARRQGETPTIRKMESFINLSNVMLVSDSKPTRVGIQVQEDGKRVRIDKRTKKVL